MAASSLPFLGRRIELVTHTGSSGLWFTIRFLPQLCQVVFYTGTEAAGTRFSNESQRVS